MQVSWMVILEHLELLEQCQVPQSVTDGHYHLKNPASFYAVNCYFLLSLDSIFILCSAFSVKLIISRCSECQPNCCFVGEGTNVGVITAGSNTSHV